MIRKILLTAVLLIAPNISEAEPFKVAAILPLSGQLSKLGNNIRQGIELAFDSLPQEQRQQLEIVFEDDQFQPENTIAAYRKLKSGGGVDAVFVAGSPPANALGPITEKDQVLLFALVASDPTIALGKEFSFIHWVTPAVLGEKLADEIQQRQFKRIAFIVAEVSGAIADGDSAIAALKGKGLGERIVYHQTFRKDDTDYRSALLQVKQKKADAVVAVIFPGALAAFAKQFRDLRVGAELIGMESFEDRDEVIASDGALVGAWYVNAANTTSEFSKDFQARFGEPPGWGAGNGYDALVLLAAALRDVGPAEIRIRDYLRSVKNFPGATGTFSASGDNRFTLPAALKRVTPTNFEEISTSSPGPRVP